MNSSGTQQTTNQTVVPPWLLPLFQQQAAVGTNALGNLSDMLAGPSGTGVPAENLVAGFTPAQQEAQNLALARARGEGGFFPTAQQTFLQAAQGTPLSSFIPEGALGALNQFAGSSPSFELDPMARQALERTAGGDFLFGGQGFDQAVDAAVRAAQPGILSRFGAAGAGGGTGGLAQTAIGQAGIDAFAGQFAQERANQLTAAQALGGFGLSLDQLGLAGREQQLGAANTLANLGVGERQRQLEAARLLPAMATADVDLLANVGAAQQAQAQRELTAPMQAMLQLLNASQTGGLSSLLGSTQTTPTSGSPLLAGLGAATSGLDLWERLFGEGGLLAGEAALAGTGSQQQPSGTGTQQPPSGLNVAGGGLAGGIAGSIGAGLATPGGTTVITEGSGQVANQVGGGGISGGGLAGGAAGVGAGLAGAGAPGGATIIADAAGNIISQGAVAGSGAAAGGAAGAAGGAAGAGSGLATALSVASAVLPAVGMIIALQGKGGVAAGYEAAVDQWGRTVADAALQEYYRRLRGGLIPAPGKDPINPLLGAAATRQGRRQLV